MHEANIVKKTLGVQVKLCHSSATSQCDTLLAYAPRESHSMAIAFNFSHLEALLIAAALYTPASHCNHVNGLEFLWI